MTTHSPNGSSNSKTEMSIVPKRFVFDLPDNELNERDHHKKLPNSRNLSLLKCLPSINGFKRQENLAEAYERICQHILILYKESRDFVLSDCLDSIKEAVKEHKTQGPVECLQLVRSVMAETCKIVKESIQKEDDSKAAQNYEKLLQKSEVKIRELIRNEQIFRITFDQFAAKDEEGEKNLAELKTKLNESNEIIEKLNKENLELKTLLHQKEEVIQSLFGDKESHYYSSNQSKYTTSAETDHTECHKPKSHSLASQNLKIFLRNNKSIPADDFKQKTNFDISQMLNLSKKTDNKTPHASTARVLHTSGTILDISTNLKSYKHSNFDTKRQEISNNIKSYGEALTERKRLESSGDLTLNNSSRLSEWQSVLRSSKRANSHKLDSNPSKAKSKSPSRTGTKRETHEGAEKPSLTAKFRPYEDLSVFLVRTEPSQDPINLASKELRNKEEECEYQLKPNMTQNLSARSKKKLGRSSKSKHEIRNPTAHLRERATNTKNLVNYKQTGTSAVTYRNMSKGQTQLTESKEDAKNSKPGVPLINVMLKQLAEQKDLPKKNLYAGKKE